MDAHRVTIDKVEEHGHVRSFSHKAQMEKSHLQRRAFTLIELLVVIGIISILAAILFPVFAQSREKAREMTCMSNEKQIGLAVAQYVTDYDDKIFYRAGWAYSRSGDIPQSNGIRWWNLLMPYVKSNNVWCCPSDGTPTLSPDVNGNATIPRSFIAVSTAESLVLAQVNDPSQTIVITEKWGSATDSWIEPFSGDFNWNPATPTQTWTAANRHFGMMNCVFFDGHAQAELPAAILASKDLTGCDLVYEYPFSGSGAPTVTSASSAGAPANVCSAFTWP
jgi:prepilin-type N-terminal cleavage/methylation domain-containing protein/prepilin-type processing-associated H-X9-DG protein